MAPEDAELAERLQAAAGYMARLGAALKGKCGLAEVEALVAQVRRLFGAGQGKRCGALSGWGMC
jgi:hypothetical protein